MGLEVERRFLVSGTPWEGRGPGVRIRQGYLSLDPARTVRVRLAGTEGTLTIKGPSRGASRAEFEYAIPSADARELIEGLRDGSLVEKVRYEVPWDGRAWVVDVFEGENRGLALAEVELDSEDEAVTLPPWAGTEVTSDPRYFNAALAAKPFSRW